MQTQSSNALPARGLILGALGVVYGDIGTSPLYALRECFAGTHPLVLDERNILGVLSLIFWALVLIICVKYITFVMRADNRGEGGIMSLMALALSTKKERHPRVQLAIIISGLFGAALLYGDGVITPAISVLSAVEGLGIITPFFTPYILPITLGILCLLFAAQRFGTAPLGAVFGCIILLWFLTLALLGLLSIFRAPEVLFALNPWHAIDFFIHSGRYAFISLAAVFLVVTGGEALYADMGHFGRDAIRIGWYAVVLPALLLNYFGQGALLLHDPAAAENPFFHLAPRWALFPLVILATCSTVIASQAVISGAFSITRQAVMLGYLPRLTIVHTSAHTIGQIYIPLVNWLLFLTTVGLVIGFKSSSNLAAAYGVAVVSTMIFTTCLLYYVARHFWHWRKRTAIPLLALFLFFDLGFAGSIFLKIFHGGWFPLLLGAVIFLIMTTWRRGREILRERLSFGMLRMEDFITSITGHPGDVARVKGTAIFMAGNPHMTPRTLLHNLKYNRVLHERSAVLTVIVEEVAHTPAETKVTVSDLGHGFFRIVARYGFMESPDAREILRLAGLQGFQVDIDQAAFFIGRETIKSTPQPGMARWREHLFIFLSKNAETPSAFFEIPPRQVVELGVQVEI